MTAESIKRCRCIGGYELERKDKDGVSSFDFSLYYMDENEETFLYRSEGTSTTVTKKSKKEIQMDYERVFKLVSRTDWAANKGNGGYTILAPLVLA